MNEKELKCEYCGINIKESDYKCPNCGANCTHIINEYKKLKKQEDEEKRKERIEYSKKIQKSINRSAGTVLVVASVIIVSILGLVVFSIFKQVTNKDNNVFESFEKSTNEDSNKKVTVKYQEKAKTNDIIVTLDSYELFEYKSDNFPEHYNTKDGYQKIAFHFIIENLSNETFNTTFDGKVSLTADDYKVSSTSMEKCVFCYTAVGKDNYESIQNTEIASSEKLQGYVGFEVPKDKKNLKFKFGDYIFIPMDNPVYQG